MVLRSGPEEQSIQLMPREGDRSKSGLAKAGSAVLHDCQPAQVSRAVKRRLHLVVYARHGHQLMRFKSSMHGTKMK